MKKATLTTSFLFLLLTILCAQNKIVEVKVHLKDGTSVEGLMKPNYNSPWQDQKSISIFDESLREAKKIKKNQKTKYKAIDIVGYEFEDRYFESKKVMIAGRGDYGSTLGALPKYALIEKLEDGAISVYKGYAYPPNVVSGVSFEEVYADIRQNPEYFLMRAADGKAKSMHSINIEKWISDSSVVSKKFAAGEYGNMKRKENKKLGNFIKGQLENENPTLIIKVVEEYNDEMATDG